MATNKNDGAKNVWDEKELGCMWKRESQKGEKYLTGVLKAEKLQALIKQSGGEDIQIICFINKGKEKETHPDLRVYFSEKRGAATTEAKPATTPTTRPAAKTTRPTPVATPAPVADSSDAFV